MEASREERHLEAAIAGLLERSGEAFSLRDLARSLKIEKKRRADLDRAISVLLADCRIHAWPGNRYGSRAFLDAMSDRVENVLKRKSPISRIALKASLPSPARPVFDAILDPLVAAGKVFEHPKAKGRPAGLGLLPPDPLDYLQPSLKKATAPFVKMFGAEAVASALRRFATALSGSSSSPDEFSAAPSPGLMAILQDVNPLVAAGALVFISDWREAARKLLPDKAAFDAAVIALAEAGTIQLQSHDRPSDLSAEEKESLIPNGRGSYFIAAGLRM